MKKKRAPVKKWIWWVIAPLVFLAGLAAAYFFLIGNAGFSAHYDDVEAILSGYTPESFQGVTLEQDGTVTLRLEKADLYHFAEEYDLQQKIHEYLNISPEEKDAHFGFRLVNGKAVIYRSGRVGGLIPVAFRAVLKNVSSGTELRLHTEKVIFGSRIVLPEKHWPEMFRSDLVLDLAQGDIMEGLTDVRLEGGALILSSEGLRMPLQGQLVPDKELLAALRVFGWEKTVDNDIFTLLNGLDSKELPMQDAEDLILSSEDVPAAFAELSALCTAGSRESLWTEKRGILREYVVPAVRAMAAERRSALEKYAGTEQSRYEKLLSTVRELYKSGGLRVDTTAFSYTSSGEAFDPTGLYSLSVTAVDSRIVFLAPGVIPAEIRFSDMPVLDTLPCGSPQAFRNMDRRARYDLGYVLSTEGGVTVLLHYREDGTFVLREISGDNFVSILVAQQNPVIILDELDRPAVHYFHHGSRDWSDSIFALSAP